jgi:hypothetical protein
MYYFVLEFDFKSKKASPIDKRYDARLLLEAEFVQWQEATKDKIPGKGGEPKVSFERYSNREYALDGMVQIVDKNRRAFGNEEEYDERVEKFKDAVRDEIVRREHEYSKQHIHDFLYYVEIKTLNPRTENETIDTNILLAVEAARLFYFDTYYASYKKGYTNVYGAKTLNDALKVALDYEKRNFGEKLTLELQGKFIERQRNRIIKVTGNVTKQEGAPQVVKAYYKVNESIGKIVCYELSPRNHPFVATIIEARAKQNILLRVLFGGEPKVIVTQTFTSWGVAEKWILDQGLNEITSSEHLKELQLTKYKNWIELFE